MNHSVIRHVRWFSSSRSKRGKSRVRLSRKWSIWQRRFRGSVFLTLPVKHREILPKSNSSKRKLKKLLIQWRCLFAQAFWKILIKLIIINFFPWIYGSDNEKTVFSIPLSMTNDATIITECWLWIRTTIICESLCYKTRKMILFFSIKAR